MIFIFFLSFDTTIEAPKSDIFTTCTQWLSIKIFYLVRCIIYIWTIKSRLQRLWLKQLSAITCLCKLMAPPNDPVYPTECVTLTSSRKKKKIVQDASCMNDPMIFLYFYTVYLGFACVFCKCNCIFVINLSTKVQMYKLMIYCHMQVVKMWGHREWLFFFGRSPELQPLPSERAGLVLPTKKSVAVEEDATATQTVVYIAHYIIFDWFLSYV